MDREDEAARQHLLGESRSRLLMQVEHGFPDFLHLVDGVEATKSGLRIARESKIPQD